MRQRRVVPARGRHRVVVTAVDAAGHAATPRTAALTVLRVRRR